MPLLWKQSIVVPIFKSGDKHNIANYRGISKLSVIPKLFEKIIYDSLFPAIKPQIASSQHGFIPGRSTETNLCEFQDETLEAMEKGYQVDAVYTDFSKAFDKISHNLLIAKLVNVGIHGDLLRWLTSYLRDRSQAVAVKGYTSSFVPITSGVPQGSHLGPLLFNIFINGVTRSIQHSKALLYADDTKIFTFVKNFEQALLFQNDLNNFYEYCSANNLKLNIDKCYTITYSRKKRPIVYNYKLNNILIKRVTEVRDLGVYLDNKLDFASHIDKATAKAYRMLGFIFRQCKDFKNINTYIMLYNSLVRSHLEYASTVWNPIYVTYVEQVERIQNKFLKRLSYKFKDHSVLHQSLELRREHRDQVFLFKLLHNYIDSPFLLSRISFRCPRLSARSNAVFSTPFCRTKYSKNRFLVRACNTHNEHYNHIDIFNCKLCGYISSIKQVDHA